MEKLNNADQSSLKSSYPETLNLPMSAWAEEDKPRRKIVDKGKSALTDSELLSLLISQEDKNCNGVEVAKTILASVNHNLNELSKLTIYDLMRFKGMGYVKANRIIAALEIGRRRKDTQPVKRERIITSLDAFTVCKPLVMDLPHEEFHIVLLNRSNCVIKTELISRGGVSGTVVDSKLIFKSAIDKLASSLILCHNHPSGNRKPSEQDQQITKKIKEAGKMLEIPVLDHIIIAEDTYFSFADEGLL